MLSYKSLPVNPQLQCVNTRLVAMKPWRDSTPRSLCRLAWQARLIEAAQELRQLPGTNGRAASANSLFLRAPRDGKPLDHKEGPYRIAFPTKKIGAAGAAGEDAQDRGRVVLYPLGLLDHHFGSLHDGSHCVALFQFQFISAAASNDAFDEVLANTNDDVRHHIS